jgi:diguanylate cyclase (GGDEF)-like protein/PAS domain S-box-containing protein
MTVAQKAFSAAYPLGDILILSVLARLLSGGGLRNAAVAFLSAGALGILAADVAYGWIQLNGTWKVGGPTDLGWVAFYVCWGAAALHPSMRQLTEKQPQRYRRLSPASLVALSAVSLVAPSLLIWRSVVAGNSNDAGIIASVSALLFVLAMARLTGLARTQAIHARREHALRTFGERLVAATGLHEVYVASLDAVAAMVGAVVVCLVTETDTSGEHVMAARPAGIVAGDLLVRDGGEPGAVADVSVAGEGPVLGAHWTSIPMSGADGSRRRLLLAHADPLPPDVVAVLDAMGDQLVLAVERVALTQVLHERRTEARFRSLVQNASDVILIIRSNGRLKAETPSLQGILGYTPETVESMTIDQLLHEDDTAQALALIESMLSGSHPTSIRTEWRVHHADGRWLQMEVLGNDLSGDAHVAGVVLVLRDVTDRKRLEDELRHQAFHDGLTNLANRVMFNEQVENALIRRDRQGMSVSVLVLDLDDFKLVNDTLGHGAGDELLVQVGKRLLGCLRIGDTAARLGGDEFAVCTESEIPAAAPTALVERIAEAIHAPFLVAGTEIVARVSIGVSVATPATDCAADMLREADLALYAAKSAGKATFRFFEPALHQAVLNRLEQRADLEKAIDEGQLCVYYQPIVRLTDARIVGVEALVRWNHPERGFVGPAEFIPVAEESGLVIPLGRWVLNRACADLADWQRRLAQAAELHMSVNVSARQLQSAQFTETVHQCLVEHGVRPSSLTLELTESVLVQDDEVILHRLQSLQGKGITLALDDFGTGYSSLSYLHRFPIGTLKIDRSFVMGMEREDGMALVDAIVSIGHSLGLDLVAEGIEDGDQAHRLELLGCQYGQGYLFARPMAAQGLEDLLRLQTPATPPVHLPAPLTFLPDRPAALALVKGDRQ